MSKKRRPPLTEAQESELRRLLDLPDDEFQVTIMGGPHSDDPSRPWVVRVALGKLTARLRQPPRGHIQLDRGSRTPGGRGSIGTSDPAEAIARAKKILFAARAEDFLDTPRPQGDTKDEMRVGDVVSLIQKTDLPKAATWDRYRRCLDIAVALWGTSRPVNTIDTAVITRAMVQRMLGIPQLKLGPVKAITALHTFKDFATCVTAVSQLRANDHSPIFRTNPIAGVKWPSEIKIDRGEGRTTEFTQRERRYPFTLDLVHELLLPRQIPQEDGSELTVPPAVDVVDPSGVLRLVVVLVVFTGRRIEAILSLLVHDILRTPEAITAGLLKSGQIDPALADQFPRGLLNFGVDKESYTHPVPIGAIVELELERYLTKTKLVDGPLFPRPSDPTQTFSYQTLCKSPWDCPRTGRTKKGWWDRVLDLVEDRLRARGMETGRVVPRRTGDGPHRFRAFWSDHVEELGYGRIGGSVEETSRIGKHVQYFGGWGVGSGNVRTDRYTSLDPQILLGIADWRRAEDVLQSQTSANADSTKSLVAHLVGGANGQDG